MSRSLVSLSLLLLLCPSASNAQEAGEGHALLVAVGEGNKLSNRPFADADVDALAAALPRAGYPARNVAILSGKDGKSAPTAANLRRELAALAKRSKAGDRVLVAVCGHAVQVKGEKETHLVPSDGKLDDVKTLVPLAELYRDVEKCQASLRLVLLDVCRTAPTDGKPALEAVCKPQEMPIPAGVAVLFANAAGETGQEVADLKRGAFFAAVVRAFEGEAATDDRVLTLRKLQLFVEDLLPKLVKTAKLKEQTPELGGKVKGTQTIATITTGPAGLGGSFTVVINRLPKLTVTPVMRPRLTFLIPGGAAEKAGLKRDDVILSLAGDDVPDLETLEALLLKHPPGARVVVVVSRDGKKVEQTVTLQKQESKEEIVAALRKAAAGKDPEVWHNLAWYLENGQGVKQDQKEAAKWYLEAAEAGHALAQVNLGTKYATGSGVEKDVAKAAEWYRKSAEQGLAFGQRLLAHAYRNGEGVEKDAARAVEWLRKAADQGEPESLSTLGSWYLNGIGVKKDAAEAVALFERAAAGGSTAAMFYLGHCYSNGEGVKQDFAQSSKWYRKAADRGNAAAMNNLGVHYVRGEGVPQSLAEGVKWYRKSAEGGNPTAQDNLGVAYETGRGVETSLAEAMRWYRKAAENGNASGQNNLGRLHDEGIGTEQDHEEAAAWFTKAAAQGNRDAQRKLGLMYLSGRGVKKNRETAVGWLKKAAAAGDEVAKKKLMDLGES